VSGPFFCGLHGLRRKGPLKASACGTTASHAFLDFPSPTSLGVLGLCQEFRQVMRHPAAERVNAVLHF
jgi:hypothetical protein